MVLTVSFVLSPMTNSFLSPSGRHVRHPDLDNRLSLDASNGRQDHTTSPSALASLVCACLLQFTCPLKSPPCQRISAPDAAASTASHPNVRDDGQRPSSGRDGETSELIWASNKAEFFENRAGHAGQQIARPGKSREDYTMPCSPEIGERRGRGTLPPPSGSHNVCCSSPSGHRCETLGFRFFTPPPT